MRVLRALHRPSAACGTPHVADPSPKLSQRLGQCTVCRAVSRRVPHAELSVQELRGCAGTLWRRCNFGAKE